MRSQLLPLAVLVALAACGTEPTTPHFGTQMTVGDQVAIEAALDRAADTVYARTGSSQDSLLSALTKIAARLIAIDGYEGDIVVNAGGSSIPMHAVAVAYGQQGLGVAHYIVAWSGLDDTAFTAQHVLLAGVGTTATTMTGTFDLPAGSATDAARWVDLANGASDVFFHTGGTLTVASSTFGGGCIGLANTAQATCATGRESVAGNITASDDGGATSKTFSWDAATIPAFHLTVQ